LCAGAAIEPQEQNGKHEQKQNAYDRQMRFFQYLNLIFDIRHIPASDILVRTVCVPHHAHSTIRAAAVFLLSTV
jgi:hypothetical protein